MREIFFYDDFIILLNDFYRKQKGAQKGFSFEYLSKKLGSPSKGFARNLFTGERTLTPPYAKKLAKLMGLSKIESQYFFFLVEMNQAKTAQQRNSLYQEIVKIRSSNLSYKKSKLLSHKHYSYLTEFHHHAIKAILGLVDFKDDYKWLSKRVFPNITPGKAKKSVDLLMELGFVERDRKGICRVKESKFEPSEQIYKQGTLNSHIVHGQLALEAMQSVASKNRYYGGATVGLSKKSFELVSDMAGRFQNEVLKLASSQKGADAVYRLNLHLFPVSKPPLGVK